MMCIFSLLFSMQKIIHLKNKSVALKMIFNCRCGTSKCKHKCVSWFWNVDNLILKKSFEIVVKGVCTNPAVSEHQVSAQNVLQTVDLLKKPFSVVGH